MAIIATIVKLPRKNHAPRVTSAYRSLDGAVHHGRCRQRMAYQGVSAGGLEIQFHCAACHERIMLPERVVAALPTSGAA